MLKRVVLASILLMFVASLASLAFARHEWYEGYKLEPYWSKSRDPLVVQYDEEHILDLTKNILVARGEARIFSFGLRNQEAIENAAIAKAQKALYDAAAGLRLSANARLSNLTAKNEALAKNINKFIKDSSNVLHCRIFTMRGTLRVTSSVKYDGPNSLLSSIYPYLATNEAANIEKIAEESSRSASPTLESGIKGDYTGLIIDARMLKLVPAIYPKIINSSGEAIFKGGKVGYSSSLNAAYKHPGAGRNPLVIKAAGARKNCEPIVSVEDGHKILGENEKTEFLERPTIIFII